MSLPRSDLSNHLLATLVAKDFERVKPHLQKIHLPVREMIENPDQPITFIVFPLAGIVSIVAHTPEYQLEVGIVGREGMTGVSVLLGAESSPHECYVQVAGEGLR